MRVPKEQKNKEPKESTNGVPAKVPTKVKSMMEESPITQKCKNLKIARTS